MNIPADLTGQNASDNLTAITTRANTGGPVTHNDIDANWNRISNKINAILDTLLAAKTSIDNLGTVDHTLPVATATTLGGVKVPSGGSLQMSGTGNADIGVNTTWLNTNATIDRASLYANGVLPNIVQGVKNDTQDFTGHGTTGGLSAAATYISGLTASITPRFTNSKFKITVHVSGTVGSGTQGDWGFHLALRRDGSVIDGATGNSASDRSRSTFVVGYYGAYQIDTSSMTYLDSPTIADVTTPIVYSIAGAGYGSGQYHINRSHSDTDDGDYVSRAISTITVEEIVIQP
jgi:hypothetical protein